MSSGQIFVITIVAMVLIASIIKGRVHSRLGSSHDRLGKFRGRTGQTQPVPNDAESEAMKAEIVELKERIKVLERITIDNHGANDVSRQIEALRD